METITDQRIANFFLSNASLINDLGLLNGKVGVAIYFYHLVKHE